MLQVLSSATADSTIYLPTHLPKPKSDYFKPSNLLFLPLAKQHGRGKNTWISSLARSWLCWWCWKPALCCLLSRGGGPSSITRISSWSSVWEVQHLLSLSCRLLFINYRLLVIIYRLLVIIYRLLVINYRLLVINYRILVINYRFLVINDRRVCDQWSSTRN